MDSVIHMIDQSSINLFTENDATNILVDTLESLYTESKLRAPLIHCLVRCLLKTGRAVSGHYVLYNTFIYFHRQSVKFISKILSTEYYFLIDLTFLNRMEYAIQ